MLAGILMSMVNQATEEELLKLLSKQNGMNLKKIMQCYIVSQYYEREMKEKINNVIDEFDTQFVRNDPTMLYNTDNFDDKEKDVLSMFENNFERSLSHTKPLINDVMMLIFSYFHYWEIYKSLAFIDKQWNKMAKAYKTIVYCHGNVFLGGEDFKRMHEINYIDYRREEDSKFVNAAYVGNSCTSFRIMLQHKSNIPNYKSGLFDPSKYCKIMAYHQSVVNQRFMKNHLLLGMKDQLIKGKLMDIKLKDCYLIYNNIKYFQIRISEWICGVICDLSFIHNNNDPKNNALAKQPYDSQIPLLVDITDWCKLKCKNDHPDTTYHNLYSYDLENKKFIKIDKNVLSHEIVLFQYWVHGDLIDEIAPFQSHSSLEEQRKMRKLIPILRDFTNTNDVHNENILNNDILKLNMLP